MSDNNYNREVTKEGFALWYLLYGTQPVSWDELLDNVLISSAFKWDMAKYDGYLKETKDTENHNAYQLTPKAVDYIKGNANEY